jgi:hypothetical protein
MLVGAACSKVDVAPAPLSTQQHQQVVSPDFFLSSGPGSSGASWQKITYTRNGEFIQEADLVFSHDADAPQLSLLASEPNGSVLAFHPAAAAGTRLTVTDAAGGVVFNLEIQAGTEVFNLAELPVTDSPTYTLTVTDGATERSSQLLGQKE